MDVIAMTDQNWYEFLRDELIYDLINFWQPKYKKMLKIREGDKCYFMLKSPIRKIGGYGTFVRQEVMTPKDAWNKYGRENGVYSFYELDRKLTNYQEKNKKKDINIGCVILKNLVFYDKKDYKSPEDLGGKVPLNLTTYCYIKNPKTYKEKKKYEGDHVPKKEDVKYFKNKSSKKIKKMVYITQRNNQDRFRKMMLSVYDNACAITGEDCIEVLEAIHIDKYNGDNSDKVQNGMPLRVDLHELFDRGLIALTCDYKIEVSFHLKSKRYQKLNNKKIRLPKNPDYYPSQDAINEHRKEFRG